MALAWIRWAAAAVLLLTGLFFMGLAMFGVNRFRRVLNRMHAAAMGDTMGILFVVLGLAVMRGFSLDSLKLLLVVAFFWIASPISSHMIGRLEAMTDEDLGDLEVIHLEAGGGEAGCRAHVLNDGAAPEDARMADSEGESVGLRDIHGESEEKSHEDI